jgi:AhpD family alkylhydroperoxidase
MTPRLNPFEADRRAMGAFLTWSQNAAAGVDPTLAHLVKTRASILNGCANCINMHTEEARKHGETEQRLYLLAAWHEAPVYTDRERAALGWTDALTLVAAKGAPADATYAALAAQFSAEEVVKLTLLINAINGWNRLAVGFGLFNPDAGAATAKAIAA